MFELARTEDWWRREMLVSNEAARTALAVTLNVSDAVLAGFGMDFVIEIAASTVVLWELSRTGERRQRLALRMVGGAFGLLALYLLVASTVVLVAEYHPRNSMPGIIWTAATALVMFALAIGKERTATALGDQVLATEGRVALIDAVLALAVMIGLTLNVLLGWGWADPVAGYVLVFYAAREVREILLRHEPPASPSPKSLGAAQQCGARP